jgi:hypothetical protein
MVFFSYHIFTSFIAINSIFIYNFIHFSFLPSWWKKILVQSVWCMLKVVSFIYLKNYKIFTHKIKEKRNRHKLIKKERNTCNELIWTNKEITHKIKTWIMQ